MPETPAYGITYPCSGDQISLETLKDYADTTQGAFDQVDDLQARLLQPPAALVYQRLNTQSIAAGVTTVATYTAAVYDTSGMFSSGAPTVLTVTQPGTYVANFMLRRGGLPTTQTSLRAALLLNGAEVAYHKSDESTVAFDQDSPIWVSALLPSLSAGSTISGNALFTGTGNMPIQVQLSATRFSIV